MAWKAVGKPVVEKLTKTLAQHFANMTRWPGDRPWNEKREESLRALLVKGKWRLDTVWASVYVEETKTEYRMNGQHTSILFSKIYDREGGAVEKLGGVSITVSRYHADSLADAADLWATFDAKVSTRTAGDINMSFASTDERLKEMSPRVINLATQALAWFKWGEQSQKGRIPQSDRSHYALENVDVIQWMNDILSTAKAADSKLLRRVPVASAMVASYKRAQGAATEFWSAVRDGSDADRDSVSRVLNRFLMTNSVNSGMGASTRKNPVSFREMYDKCVHAWNAYRAGKTSLLLKHIPDSEPPRVR